MGDRKHLAMVGSKLVDQDFLFLSFFVCVANNINKASEEGLED